MRSAFSLITVLISVVIIATVGVAALSLTIEAVKNERYAANLRRAVDRWSVERVLFPYRLKTAGYFRISPLTFKRLTFSISGFRFEEVAY